MLTLPQIVERNETPYVAIAEKVHVPFGPVIDRLMPEVAGWLSAKGKGPNAPAIFRYDWVDMPALEMQFGFLTQEKLAGDARVTSGTLPAGKYAAITWFGHYDSLVEVNATLLGWMRLKGIEADSKPDGKGERFACRAELYPNGPMDEPDPGKWQTELIIKIGG
jgi:effector-binding domain-containing protein